MQNLILRLLINAAALWAAAALVPGIGFGGQGQDAIITILWVALIFGIVNALIKPIIQFFTCPFYLLTLGVFTFIVNALMLLLTASLAGSFGQTFVVDGFGSAFFGGIVISIVSTLLSIFATDEDKK